MVEIRATKLTQEAFAPFGRHMRIGQDGHGMASRMIRQGTVQLTQSAQGLDSDPGAAWSLDFYDAALTPEPLAMTVAEQHPFSAQVFVPMGTTRWLVVVWPRGGDGAPTGTPRAFVAGPEDAVSYDAGIWHHGIIALEGSGRFASMMGRMPQGGDTVFADLSDPLTVRWTA